MKVLVLGAGGMAGHTVATYLSERGYDVETLSARNKLNSNTVLIDVTDKSRLKKHLEHNQYDSVINCVGLLVKQSEDRKDLAAYLNSYLPHFLEEFYKNTNTKLIHLSTDCVFSGLNAPYREDSPYDGTMFYDRSKALGEVINDKDLTFRMSIIGPDMHAAGTGLFNWYYAQRGTINGYTGSVWNGVTTIELAKGIDEAIKQNLTGLYHFSPKKNITKFNLLKLIGEVFGRTDIIVMPIEGVSHDKTLVNTRSDFNYSIPAYPQMVEEMHEWILQHKDLYKHYE